MPSTPTPLDLPYEHVSLREGLRRGRGHLVFLLALSLAMGLIWALDGVAPEPAEADRVEAAE